MDPVSSGLIHFDVGVADKQLSLSLFESPRDCTAAEFGHPSVDLSKPRDDDLKVTLGFLIFFFFPKLDYLVSLN